MNEQEQAAYDVLTHNGWVQEVDREYVAALKSPRRPYSDTCQDTLPGVLTTPHVMRMV